MKEKIINIKYAKSKKEKMIVDAKYTEETVEQFMFDSAATSLRIDVPVKFMIEISPKALLPTVMAAIKSDAYDIIAFDSRVSIERVKHIANNVPKGKSLNNRQ
jgi:hypothetical protein